MSNMAIWEQVQTTPGEAAKAFDNGQFKGTSANPTFNARRATELFGPYGTGWWVEIEKDELVNLGSPEKPSFVHTLQIALRYRYGGEEGVSRAFGQTPASYITSKGYLKVDDNYAKKSMTDAISKALQLLGFSADIWMGMWDDVKYVQQRREEFKEARQNSDDRRRARGGHQSRYVKPADDVPPHDEKALAGYPPIPEEMDGPSSQEPETHEMTDEILVRYDEHDEKDQEWAATPAEAATALAPRLKAASYFFASRMLGLNSDWIGRLDRAWQDRLEAIVLKKGHEAEAQTTDLLGRGHPA